MGDLEDLHSRQAERDGHGRLGVGGQQNVGAPVGRDENDRVLVRVSPGGPGRVRPENAELEVAEAIRLSLARDHDAHVLRRGRAHRGGFLRALVRDAGIEDETDAPARRARRRAADVVALGMRENDRGETADAEVVELPGDVGLGRPLVDEYRPSGTWSSVPSPWPTSRNVTRRPDGGAAAASSSAIQTRQPATRVTIISASAAVRGPRWRPSLVATNAAAPMSATTASAPREARRACGRPATNSAHQARYAASHPLTQARANAADGKTGFENRADEGEPEKERDDRCGERVREHGVDRNRAEVEPEHRRRDKAAADRDRKPLGDLRPQRIALEPTFDPWDDDEDRGDGDERKLEARLEERVRIDREKHRGADEQEVPAIRWTRREPRERQRAVRRRPRGRRTAASRPRPCTRARRRSRRDAPTQRRTPAIHAATRIPPTTYATFWPDTASRWYKPDALKSSRSGSLSRSSSPRTMPPITARRSPVSPGAIDAASQRRSRSVDAENSAAPPDLTERTGAQDRVDALAAQVLGLVETAVGCGRLGASIVATSSRTAPCGGARPSGSSRRAGSSNSARSKRLTRTGTRTANFPARAGPVTSTWASPASPMRAASALWSSSFSRIEPHHTPTSASPSASAASRRAPARNGAHRTASAATTAAAPPTRTTSARPRPTQSEPGEQVRGPDRLRAHHRSTNSFSCSRRAGPIPGTASSSSTDWNAPCSVR